MKAKKLCAVVAVVSAATLCAVAVSGCGGKGGAGAITLTKGTLDVGYGLYVDDAGSYAYVGHIILSDKEIWKFTTDQMSMTIYEKDGDTGLIKYEEKSEGSGLRTSLYVDMYKNNELVLSYSVHGSYSWYIANK